MSELISYKVIAAEDIYSLDIRKGECYSFNYSESLDICDLSLKDLLLKLTYYEGREDPDSTITLFKLPNPDVDHKVSTRKNFKKLVSERKLILYRIDNR